MTRSPDTGGGPSLEVHRLLDEAFAGIEMTPERQDMKEEIRANLVARVEELRDGGLSAAEAARRAVDDLGDVRSILDDVGPGGAGPSGSGPLRSGPPSSGPLGSGPLSSGPRGSGDAATAPDWGLLWSQHRVRPDPMFLVRTVVLSVAGLAGLAVLALDPAVTEVPLAARLAAVLAVALTAGGITLDALRQETTSHHPMPTARAAGYAGALAAVLLGAGAAWQYVPERAVGWLVAGPVPVLAGVVLFTYLLGSQTNRNKTWWVHQAARTRMEDRFTQDPAAAARFGLYTVVTWLVAAVVFAALTLTVGWTWSWTALVSGLAVTMLTLARMLFDPRDRHRGAAPEPRRPIYRQE